MVVLGVAINFWQSYRSQQAADRLRASVTPTATVLRDGAWQETPLRNVVPGDVFRLSAGDLVPADARLLESRDLSVQQSMLTGESLPADKAAAVTPSGDDAAPTRPIWCSSARRSSAARARRWPSPPVRRRCSATSRCGWGAASPETEFEHGLRRFSLLILRTTVVLVLFILLMSIAFKHDAFESLLFAVALGVGLTPEFLPMISSVTLTQGALRMARDQVIVKHLPAIQNFGSIDILCSDKTGTLTAGVMQFDRALDPTGRGIAAAVDAGLHQQPVRDRHSQSARCRDSSAAVGRRHGLPEDRRNPVRFRAAPPLRGGGGAGRRGPPAAHHQGCARADPRAVHGVRSRRSGRAARRGHEADVRGGPRALERGRSARPGGRLPLAGAAGRLLARRRGRSRAGRLRQLRRSGPAGRRARCWRSSSATASP